MILDAGHGGSDPGAVSISMPAIFEKDITLASVHSMRLNLIKSGIIVYLTRALEASMSLEHRVRQANGYGSDLFISIHANAAENHTAQGFEVHYYSSDGLAVSRHIIDAVKKAGYNIHGGGIFQSDFYVLRKTKMIAILIELGFITNDQDLALLMSSESRGKLIDVVSEAILTWV